MFQSHCWNMGPSNETSFCIIPENIITSFAIACLRFPFRSLHSAALDLEHQLLSMSRQSTKGETN